MTNKERQASIDKKKWFASKEVGYDTSGMSIHCYYCNKQNGDICLATQEERESQCLCAKAYNRMKRVNGERK